jgi:hypothetical protein
MPDPFKSAKLCCEWGKKHSADLRRQILTFIKTKPYSTVVDPDPDGVLVFHKLKLHPVPEEFALIAGEAIGFFRKALDHAVYRALGVTGKVKPARGVTFPFHKTESDFKDRTIFKKFPNEIKPFFERLKPYEAGNLPLWALNHACNIDKHRMLIVISVGAHARLLAGHDIFADDGKPFGDSSKNEIVYAIVGPNETVEYQAEFTLGVAFGEIDALQNKLVIGVLDDFSRIVDSILLGFEAECRRLGYIK